MVVDDNSVDIGFLMVCYVGGSSIRVYGCECAREINQYLHRRESIN
jgi:hypothetical protein